MKYYRILTLVLTIVTLFKSISSASAIGSNDAYLRFGTNHGELTFVDAQGKLSFDAIEIKLNGKTLLKAESIHELWGDGQQHVRQQYLSVATIGKGIIHQSIQEKARHKPGERPIKIERLLVAEG